MDREQELKIQILNKFVQHGLLDQESIPSSTMKNLLHFVHRFRNNKWVVQSCNYLQPCKKHVNM